MTANEIIKNIITAYVCYYRAFKKIFVNFMDRHFCISNVKHHKKSNKIINSL